MKNIRNKLLIQIAKIGGLRCSKCGKRMADYNKLSRYIARENPRTGFHYKGGDGICYICQNPTCSEFEKAQFVDSTSEIKTSEIKTSEIKTSEIKYRHV